MTKVRLKTVTVVSMPRGRCFTFPTQPPATESQGCPRALICLFARLAARPNWI